MDAPFASLVLPARLDSMPAFREFMQAGAASAGLEEPELGWLDLVLEEILVNIARGEIVDEEDEALADANLSVHDPLAVRRGKPHDFFGAECLFVEGQCRVRRRRGSGAR